MWCQVWLEMRSFTVLGCVDRGSLLTRTYGNKLSIVVNVPPNLSIRFFSANFLKKDLLKAHANAQSKPCLEVEDYV